MKRQWTVAIFVALAASCLTLVACQPSDKRDPLREAEATRLVQEAQYAAAQRAIERDILQAKADKAEAELVAWAMGEEDGYLAQSEIRRVGQMGQREARRLADQWDRRGWLE